ncbi:MAG: hypothetical protein IKS41_01800 [Alphaproteobacteria bacterium]|nr:hypothetical protein [Alphaproteobacteria bacterium]
MICPKCHSQQIKKNGLVFGAQRYRCKDCGHQFIPDAPHGRDLTDKATAMALCHLGVSQNQTARILKTTPTSISRWLSQMPTSLPFKFNQDNHLSEIEETTLCSYIKKLYIENKENFLISQNHFGSDFEVDVIIKNKKASPEKAGKGLLVCAFGDSLLQGVVHDAQVNKYKILRENFVALSEQRFNVVWKNYARHGSTVLDGEKAFLSHLSQVQDSDYILFSFGGNECNHDWDKISQNPNLPHKPKLTLKQFHDKYIQLIQMAQKRGKTPILFSLPPLHAENFVRSVCLGRNQSNIMKFLHNDISIAYRWHSMYNLEIFKIARERDIPIIDISTCFLAKLDYAPYLCDDGVHPNEKGHQLIAEALKEFYCRYF